jgi:hypothetical protein
MNIITHIVHSLVIIFFSFMFLTSSVATFIKQITTQQKHFLSTKNLNLSFKNGHTHRDY